jgi:hypothetical protein
MPLQAALYVLLALECLDAAAVKFSGYIAELAKVAFSSSLALGLVLGILVLVTGGAEGSITLDIDIAATDSIWFLLATPVLATAVFLLISPLSYFVYSVLFKKKTERTGNDA